MVASMPAAVNDLETSAVKDEQREELMARRKAVVEEEDEDEMEVGRFRRITPKLLKKLIKEQKMFNTPSLNDKLYLHYHGFAKIEGLAEWTGCALALASPHCQ